MLPHFKTRLFLHNKILFDCLTVKELDLSFQIELVSLSVCHMDLHLLKYGSFSLTAIFSLLQVFLANLWGAYAIPVVLSGVRRVSSVSTITTRNN